MEQKSDPELVRLAVKTMTEEEMKLHPEGYCKQSGGLMRKLRPRDTSTNNYWRNFSVCQHWHASIKCAKEYCLIFLARKKLLTTVDLVMCVRWLGNQISRY